jgi:hypothetical protein
MPIDRYVLNKSFITIIRGCDGINPGLSISPIEQFLLLVRRISAISQAAADEHQIPPLGRKGKLVSINAIQGFMLIDEQVPSVHIGMAQHKCLLLSQNKAGELFPNRLPKEGRLKTTIKGNTRSRNPRR